MTDKKVIEAFVVSDTVLQVALDWFPKNKAKELDVAAWREINSAIDRGPIQIVIPEDKT